MSYMSPEQAYQRGWGRGEQAALNKQPRVITEATFSELGPDAGDAGQRSMFSNGFYGGYDKAAAGMGVVGPGGKTATSVLKDITTAEGKKAENPYGARQTELDLNYRAFNTLVEDEKSKYSDMAGGIAFLGDWRSLMNDWQTANASDLGDDMLSYYEQQLEAARQKREALIAADAVAKGFSSFTKLPESIVTLPTPPVPGMTQQATNKPATPAVAPVAGKILGMPRNVAIGVAALALVGAASAGIYYATREEYELGPDGKPKLGPDGKPIPKKKPTMLPAKPPMGAR